MSFLREDAIAFTILPWDFSERTFVNTICMKQRNNVQEVEKILIYITNSVACKLKLLSVLFFRCQIYTKNRSPSPKSVRSPQIPKKTINLGFARAFDLCLPKELFSSMFHQSAELLQDQSRGWWNMDFAPLAAYCSFMV